MPDPGSLKHIFRDGDYVLMVDNKGRRYLIKLSTVGEFQSHLGNFSHRDLLGQAEGARIATGKGHWLLAFKPTMADFAKEMPRIATVIYPKDLSIIMFYGDIRPGDRVLEAGTGSGAMTMALLRAVGERGKVISYDLRQDMIDRARANISVMFPTHSALILKLGDVYDGFEEKNLDRIVLDLAEPWRTIPSAADALVPGGILVSFLPTVLQFYELTRELRQSRRFDIIETAEVMVRNWSVSGRSVRPVHRMVGHTGFITTARKCEPIPFLGKAECGNDANDGIERA